MWETTEAVKSKNPCQGTLTLPHPMPLPALSGSGRHTRNGVGVVGRRAPKLVARHASCSARSWAPSIARRVPGSRCAERACKTKTGRVTQQVSHFSTSLVLTKGENFQHRVVQKISIRSRPTHVLSPEEHEFSALSCRLHCSL